MSSDPRERVRFLEARLDILTDTLRSFAEAATDYERALEVTSRQLAQVVKDGCVVRLLGQDGWLSAVSVCMPIDDRITDPVLLGRVREHIAAPHNIKEQAAAARVIEQGECVLVPKLDLDELGGSASPEIVEVYRTIGIHSLLLVPLRAQGESIGIVSLARFTTAAAFTEQDRELALTLADHAALAIDNARLIKSALRELHERQRAEQALRKAEHQLRHAQKMEAVGRLAGSVAHDFNNLLSVILGHGLSALEELRPVDPVRDSVAEMVAAGERAAQLTRQLLAFSRQQVMDPRVLDLNDAVKACENMLRRLIGADVEIVIRCARGLSMVRADAGQIDQVIMNLAINARDAMPDGGKLTIETKDVVLDDGYVTEHFGAASGPHVMLAVSDSGIGMDQETQARIFEPFFTTKEVGKGTGLGLSTVFGIVKQSGGNVWVYSEPGKGTTFKVYLPRVADSEFREITPTLQPVTLTGNETILLVEDQDEVRRVAHRILSRYGYHVIEARNAGEALLTCEQYPQNIHLLLSDVVMPMLSGMQLAQRLQAVRPAMKVLFMSGYTENAALHHGILESSIAYLQKPLVPETLARRVREVLDSRR